MPPIFFEKKNALILFFTSKIDIEKQLSLCAIILKRPLKLLLMLVCDCFATIFCAFISISITFALDIDKINRRMYNVIVTRAKKRYAVARQIVNNEAGKNRVKKCKRHS